MVRLRVKTNRRSYVQPLYGSTNMQHIYDQLDVGQRGHTYSYDNHLPCIQAQNATI